MVMYNKVMVDNVDVLLLSDDDYEELCEVVVVVLTLMLVVVDEVKEETPLAKDVAQLLQKLKKKGAFEPDCKST